MALAGQGTDEQRLNLVVVSSEHAVAQRQIGRIDQAAEVGRVLEQLVQPLQRAAQPVVVAGQRGPVGQLALHRDARAGEVKRGQRAVAAGFPGREGQCERGDLGAARVQLQAVDVIADGHLGSGARVQLLFFHAHASQHLKRGDQEVARAAARVDHGHLGGMRGPAGECACGRCAVVAEAQIAKRLNQRTIRMAGGPPRTERVFEQELDHIVLGEQLGHRRDVGATDLAPALVHSVFALCLPELVNPAERVIGSKNLRRQIDDNPL